MKRKKKYNSKAIQKKLLRILVVLVLIVLTLGSLTLAKYMSQLNSDKIIGRPDGFYFESDYLTVNNSPYEMQNWNRDKDYSFIVDIRNFQDSLRASEMDVSYKLEISELGSNVKASLNGNNVTSNTTFKMSADQTVTDQLLITVPKGETPSNNKIQIKATAVPESSNGYSKEISAVFTLIENSSTFELQLENHKDYYDLLIGVAKSGQTMTINWPSGFTPDSTVTELKNATTTSASYTTNGDDTSVRLRFFVTGVIDKSTSFSVKDSNGIEKTVKISDAQ